MTKSLGPSLPPGQQLVAAGKWPLVGERAPLPTDSPWQVEIGGEVEHPTRYSLEALRAMPQSEQIADIHCVTRWSLLGIRFGGVALRELLKSARPRVGARFVSFEARSARAHSTSLPFHDAIALNAMLALDVDGQPLPLEHGGPVRMIVPGRYFYKSLKWLARIELLEEDRLGYWEGTAGYHNGADPEREQRYIASGISRTAAHELLAGRDLRGRDLLGLSAESRELAGLQAQNALLRDADFRGSNLAGACFDGANLSNAHFQRANLEDASFRGADLEGANFEGANLKGACLLADSILAVTFVDPAVVDQGARFDGQTEFSTLLLDQLLPAQQAYVHDALHQNWETP